MIMTMKKPKKYSPFVLFILFFGFPFGLAPLLLSDSASALASVPASEASSLDFCRLAEGERAEKIITMISPELFLRTERPGTAWKYSAGASYSLVSLWTHSLEFTKFGLECRRQNHLNGIAALIRYSRNGVRLRPLQKQRDILLKAETQIKKLNAQMDLQFQNRLINLQKLYASKKFFYRILQEKNRVERDLKLLQEQGAVGTSESSGSSLISELPEKISAKGMEEMFENEVEWEKADRKIRILKDLDITVEWGRTFPRDKSGRADDYVGANLVFPLDTLGSLLLFHRNVNRFDTWNRRKLEHPGVRLQQLIGELKEEVEMERKNLQELSVLFPQDMMGVFRQWETSGEMAFSDLWMENILFFAEKVYLESYLQELQEVIKRIE